MTPQTIVKRCTCTHAYQDAVYGRGNRVHNAKRGNGGNTGGWRCTVCAKESQ
jgi:hypothetical protein